MYFNRPNLNTLSQHTHAHIVAGVTGVYILSANKHADKSLANNKKWNESSRSNDSVLHALLLRVWVCVCLLFLTFFLSLSHHTGNYCYKNHSLHFIRPHKFFISTLQFTSNFPKTRCASSQAVAAACSFLLLLLFAYQRHSFPTIHSIH